MSYRGNSLLIPLDVGGLVGRREARGVLPTDFTLARNIRLQVGGIQKREGSSIIASHGGGVAVIGLTDFIIGNGSQFQVVVNDAGDIYTVQDTGTNIKTGWLFGDDPSFETFNDKLYISTSNAIPQVWTGTGSTSDLANPAADWTGSSFPKQIIRHGRKNSERLWAIGAPSTPFTVYASGLGTDNFVTGVVTIPVTSRDGTGNVGGIVFGDRLIVFSKDNSYIIDDSSLTIAEWGYQESQWLGGVAHKNLIIRTPNDIICMMENGIIYSFTTAQQFGDYKAASLTTKSFMHEWINENIDLGQISKFHGVYHPKEKAVFIWTVRKGFGYPDTALVHYIDRPVEKSWEIQDAWDHNGSETEAGFAARSSAIVKFQTGDYKIFTGAYLGDRVFRLGESARADNGVGFTGGVRLGIIDGGDPTRKKRFDRVRIIGKQGGSSDIDIAWNVDGVDQSAKTINMFVSGFQLDSSQLDIDSFGPDFQLLDKFVNLRKIGKRIELEFSNNDVNTDFFLSQVILDFKFLGKKP